MSQEKLSTPSFLTELVSKLLSEKDRCLSDYYSPSFWSHLHSLHRHHLICSDDYKHIASHFCGDQNYPYNLPFIPVSLFKDFELKSIQQSEVYRVLYSSGTSAQRPSRIFLDRHNSRHQQIALSDLFTKCTGLSRPNILIIDTPSTSSRSAAFTARKAGILGFTSLCRKSFFALNNDYSLNHEAIEKAIANSQSLLLFGFTFIIYKYFIQSINHQYDFSLVENVVLLHGGGWKKLQHEAITTSQFNSLIKDRTSIQSIINYYGMVEQTGSLFFECPLGFMHTNYLASVIPRDPYSLVADFSVSDRPRLAQVLSVLPTSYPGHSLLTDDLISIPYKPNQCPCGQQGLPFVIHGRLPSVEARGCSDTHE